MSQILYITSQTVFQGTSYSMSYFFASFLFTMFLQCGIFRTQVQVFATYVFKIEQNSFENTHKCISITFQQLANI